MKRLMAVKKLVALLGAFALVACLDVSGPGPSDPATETFAENLNLGDLHDTAVWKRGPNGTYFRDDVLGTGASLFLDDRNDTIYVDYTGWLKDGTQFDAANAAALWAANLIPGFLDGMVDMRIGGTRTIVVPSNLGFGNSRRGVIQPNSTLVFRIHLNSFTGAP